MSGIKNINHELTYCFCINSLKQRAILSFNIKAKEILIANSQLSKSGNQKSAHETDVYPKCQA